MKILTLNCQKNHGSGVAELINQTLQDGEYDFLLLQELVSSVLDNIRPDLSSYKLLRVVNDEVGDWSQVCILYRTDTTLLRHTFFPFIRFSWQNLHRREFGLLLGTFNVQGTHTTIGTLHVNAGPQFRLRNKELVFAKQCILEYNHEQHPVVFGGDFNSGFPWENKRNQKIFAPEFVNCTCDSGPTCDSRYVEPLTLLNRLARWLAIVGIHFQLKVDHIYVDRETAQSSTTQCRVLPVRVSDHSPLELLIK